MISNHLYRLYENVEVMQLFWKYKNTLKLQKMLVNKEIKNEGDNSQCEVG